MKPSRNAAPITVLIADDHEPLRDVLRRLISRQDDLRVVDTAATGEEAVSLALDYRPAVVIMDSSMPGIGGVEATRRLVQSLPDVRVIGYSSCDHSAAMRSAGAVKFVDKGSPPAVLIAAIRTSVVQAARPST